jgi:hypothetical protein
MKIKPLDKKAIMGGILSLGIIVTGTLLLGKLSGYEAKTLIQHSLSGMHTLCNTVALASATILALLLTLLGISSGSKSKLKKQHYIDVLQIAKLDTAVFIASVTAFLIFNLPITESENVPENWFKFVYYISLSISSILSSSLIVVVIMLYNTIVNIITIIGLKDKNHPLVAKETEKTE